MSTVTLVTVGRKPTRREKKARTRQKLIDAAAVLFRERGFRATTLDQVAEQAGLTKGAVYSNFASKEELLLAACEKFAVTPDLSAFEDSDQSLEDQLRQFVVDAVQLLDSPEVSELNALELEAATLAQHDERTRAWVTETRRRNRLRLAALLRERAQHLGLDLPLPYVEMATLLDATVRGLALHRMAEPDAAPDSLFADAISLILGAAPKRSRREITKANRQLDADLSALGYQSDNTATA